MQREILVIEDDPNIGELIASNLEMIGFTARVVGDGEVGLRTALGDPFALIILDLMLPTLDGVEICKEIRRKNMHVPILMLTAKSEEIDRIIGLELGADDYVTKPFSVRELMARVKALVRRSGAAQTAGEMQGKLQFGGLVLDLDRVEAALDGIPLNLTPVEFELLHILASRPGRTVSREQLVVALWGNAVAGYEKTVNTHLSRLRQKIEPDPDGPKYIHTVRGIGYRFADSSDFEEGAE